MRSFSVSSPCRNRNELNGLRAGPEVAQPFDARLHDVGEVAEGLKETDAVIALARFEKLRKAAPVPGKSAAVHDDSADGGAMAADEFGGGMDHDVGAVLDGPAQIRRSEGIVDR